MQGFLLIILFHTASCTPPQYEKGGNSYVILNALTKMGRNLCINHATASSRNVALLSCHSSFGSISSIRFANSGGVNTSSLDRFVRQVRTSGLYILLQKSLIILRPSVIGQRIFPDGRWDKCLNFFVILPADHENIHLLLVSVQKLIECKITILHLIACNKTPLCKNGCQNWRNKINKVKKTSGFPAERLEEMLATPTESCYRKTG